MKTPVSASSPATAADLALMQGAPPPPAQHVTLASWQEGPHNRWSFQHASEFVPTANLSRGDGPVFELPTDLERLDGLAIRGVACASTLEEFLSETYTDGFLILHEGRVRYERYLNGMTPATRHLLHSISKSFCGALTGEFVERGVVELDAPVRAYVPELWDSAYGDATVANLLDMTASVRFSEDYTDPASEVQAQDRAAGWRPRRAEDPENSYLFLRALVGDGRPHGSEFQYCSATTDTLAWVLERATGCRYTDLFADALWSRIGAEHEASITVDSAGFAFANGGVSTTLRDLARFGYLMLHGGTVDGFRATPPNWAARHRDNGDPSLIGSEIDFAVAYPNGSYSAGWWCTGDAAGTYYGAGIYGQFLWIVPEASLVIVKLSSLPRPLDPAATRDHREGFHAIVNALT